jgi:hypothetical protein
MATARLCGESDGRRRMASSAVPALVVDEESSLLGALRGFFLRLRRPTLAMLSLWKSRSSSAR